MLASAKPRQNAVLALPPHNNKEFAAHAVIQVVSALRMLLVVLAHLTTPPVFYFPNRAVLRLSQCITRLRHSRQARPVVSGRAPSLRFGPTGDGKARRVQW